MNQSSVYVTGVEPLVFGCCNCAPVETLPVTTDQHYVGPDKVVAIGERGDPGGFINVHRVPVVARLAGETELSPTKKSETFLLVNKCICGCRLAKVKENKQSVVDKLRFETYCDTCACRQPMHKVVIDEGPTFCAMCCSCNNVVEKKVCPMPVPDPITDAERDAGVIKSTAQFDYII